MPRPDDQPVQVPGVAPPPDTAASDADAGDSAEVAALRAELDALKAKEASAPKIVDGTVFEPVTPHGAVALAESEFASMTAAEAHQRVQAGEITLGGKPSVLCADGYYCDPNYR